MSLLFKRYKTKPGVANVARVAGKAGNTAFKQTTEDKVLIAGNIF
jgi:hypothetical protein